MLDRVHLKRRTSAQASNLTLQKLVFQKHHHTQQRQAPHAVAPRAPLRVVHAQALPRPLARCLARCTAASMRALSCCRPGVRDGAFWQCRVCTLQTAEHRSTAGGARVNRAC